MKRQLTVGLYLLVCLALFAVPVFAQDDSLMENLDGCVAEGDYDPDVNYFPEQVEVDYAEGFTVEYFNNYKLVTLDTMWGESAEYVLVQCGTPAPDGMDEATVINVPVQTFVSASTTFLPHLVDQGLLDRLVGMDSLFLTSMPEVLEAIDAGDIVPVYADFAPDMEAFLALDPELTMVQDFSVDGTAGQLADVGLNAVQNYDFNDSSPLGQAEWGKYIALFFNTEAEANAIFEVVSSEYTALVELTADVENRSTVMANAPYDGVWYMPGGNSVPAQAFADAGADFLWADNEDFGSQFLDFETVLAVAGEADFWVNVDWTTLENALAVDPNFAEFAPFENGTVYAYNNAVGPNGGNLFFELGIANPHLALADLIAIFHPELLPEHELYFYRPVE